MPATVSTAPAHFPPLGRSSTRGATATALLGGMTLLLGGLGLGLLLASGRAAPQGAYEAPVLPGRARVARPRPATGPLAPPPTPAKEPGPATPTVAPAASTPPVAPPPTGAEVVKVPSARPAFRPGEVGVVLTGADAAAVALDAARDLSPAGDPAAATPSAPAATRVVVVSDADADAPLRDARAVVALEADALRVRVVSPPPLSSDPIASLVPPASLVGDALADVRLPVPEASRAGAVAAFGLLLADRPVDALRVLRATRGLEAGAGAPAPTGARILRAYALLLTKQLSAVHDEVLGLGADPDVGPVARLLTGAALLVDGNPREAIRDFTAALAARAGYWPARLLLGAANDRLALPEAAKEAYASVLAAVPGRPEAIVGYAPHLATTDRAAAVSLVEGLLAERPSLVSGWWQLAWLRRTGSTSEDQRREVEAMEHVTALASGDADAWGALGGARARWAASGGGVAAQRAASEAFARQCELAPEDGLAWFNRAATLHQVALETPLDGDATALAPRVAQARTAYGKALARGLSRTDAARVHFNLGLLLDALPGSASDPVPAGFPRRSIDAYASALASDPGYAEAGLALSAAQIGARDAKAASTALASLPPGVDPREKAILEAALAHVKGDPAGTTRLLSGAGKVPVAGSDALPTLARELLLLGYRRLVVSLLDGDATRADRLALRARARAGLADVAGTRADLAALETLDPAKAADLRRNDPDVRRTLGPPR